MRTEARRLRSSFMTNSETCRDLFFCEHRLKAEKDRPFSGQKTSTGTVKTHIGTSHFPACFLSGIWTPFFPLWFQRQYYLQLRDVTQACIRLFFDFEVAGPDAHRPQLQSKARVPSPRDSIRSVEGLHCLITPCPHLSSFVGCSEKFRRREERELRARIQLINEGLVFQFQFHIEFS